MSTKFLLLATICALSLYFANTYNLINCDNEERTNIYLNENAWFECDDRKQERLRYCVICDQYSNKTSGEYILKSTLADFSDVPVANKQDDTKLAEFCNSLKSRTCASIKATINDSFLIFSSAQFVPKAGGRFDRWTGSELAQYNAPVAPGAIVSPSNQYLTCSSTSERKNAYIYKNAWYECDIYGKEHLKYCIICDNTFTSNYGKYVSRHALTKFGANAGTGEIELGTICNNLAAWRCNSIQNGINFEFDITCKRFRSTAGGSICRSSGSSCNNI